MTILNTPLPNIPINPPPVSVTSEDGASANKPGNPDMVILDLRVRNHPGVMSHITGLFARRSFNVEGILCLPTTDTEESCVFLLLANTPRLDQIERQLAKLYDVLAMRRRDDLNSEFFLWLAELSATARK
ncbi:MAG: ACT domain-containing protein [Puniceicoccales bacterium]|jgi:acetolactate synthase-1/3 small subunit|nr:ACT domain-containing protein [Puniceicoccales bacterium]